MIINVFRFFIGLVLTLFIWDNSQSDLRISFSILYFAYMVCATLYDVIPKKNKEGDTNG